MKTIRWRFFLPYTVEDSSRGKYSDVNVWNDDVVKMSEFLILEKGVRHPNSASLGHCQIFQLSCKKMET